MPSVYDLLADLAFSEIHYVLGRASIADLFRPGQRCGIYVLHFTNGEFYCGQSVDVTRRFVEHIKVHTDIERISFKQILQDHLNAEEHSNIRTLEAQDFRLRNIALTSIPFGPSDLDLIMTQNEQNRWCNDLSFVDHVGTRIIEPNLRRKYRQRYEQLIALPYANETIRFLRAYAHSCLPAIRRTEVSFWSCSCLPGDTNGETEILARVNIYWQEVLTIGVHNEELFFSFHLAKKPLITNQLTTKLFQWIYKISRGKHQYKPGGQDQTNLIVDGAGNALALIKTKNFLQAIRIFNIRLMKKGACTSGRYHCLDLADQIVPNEDNKARKV
jgi:hypothetical protein